MAKKPTRKPPQQKGEGKRTFTRRGGTYPSGKRSLQDAEAPSEATTDMHHKVDQENEARREAGDLMRGGDDYYLLGDIKRRKGMKAAKAKRAAKKAAEKKAANMLVSLKPYPSKPKSQIGIAKRAAATGKDSSKDMGRRKK